MHKVIGVGSGSTIVSVVAAFAKDLEAQKERWFIPTGVQSRDLIVESGLRLGDVGTSLFVEIRKYSYLLLHRQTSLRRLTSRLTAPTTSTQTWVRLLSPSTPCFR